MRISAPRPGPLDGASHDDVTTRLIKRFGTCGDDGRATPSQKRGKRGGAFPLQAQVQVKRVMTPLGAEPLGEIDLKDVAGGNIFERAADGRAIGLAIERAGRLQRRRDRRRRRLGRSQCAIDRLAPRSGAAFDGRTALASQVPRPELDAPGSVIDRDSRVMKRQADIGKSRVACRLARKAFDPGSQVIREDADEAPLKGWQRGSGCAATLASAWRSSRPASVVRMSPSPFSTAPVSDCERHWEPVASQIKARIGCEDAPAAGVAESWTAFEDRGLWPGADHRSQ